MTVRIDLPDDQATALEVKAPAQSLSLEEWLRRIVTREVSAERAISKKSA